MNLENIYNDLVALIAVHGSKRNDCFIDPDVVMLGFEMGHINLPDMDNMTDAAIAFAIYETVDAPWWINESQIALSLHSILLNNGTYDPTAHNPAIAELAQIIVNISNSSPEAMENTMISVSAIESIVRFHNASELLAHFGWEGYQFTDLNKVFTLLTDLNRGCAILPANDNDPDIVMFPDHPMIENLPGALAVAAALGELVPVH